MKKEEKQKSKENENSTQFIRIFNNVRKSKDIKALDKLILSHMISYQLQNKEFFMSNKRIGYEYGVSESTAARSIKRLDNYIEKRLQKMPAINGERPKNRRFVKVKNIQQWTSVQPKQNTSENDFTKFKTANDFFDWLNSNMEPYEIQTFLVENEDALLHLESLKGVGV